MDALHIGDTITATIRRRTWTLKITGRCNGQWRATHNGGQYRLLVNVTDGALSVFAAEGYYSHTLNLTGWTIAVRECRAWAHIPGIACRCCGVS